MLLDCPKDVFVNEIFTCNLTLESKSLTYSILLYFGDGENSLVYLNDNSDIISKKYNEEGSFNLNAVIQNNTNYFISSIITGNY